MDGRRWEVLGHALERQVLAERELDPAAVLLLAERELADAPLVRRDEEHARARGDGGAADPLVVLEAHGADLVRLDEGRAREGVEGDEPLAAVAEDDRRRESERARRIAASDDEAAGARLRPGV